MSFNKHFSFFLLLIGFCSTQVFAQKKVAVTQLLDSLSKRHNIHFTYKSDLLKNKTLDLNTFDNLSLNKSIELLKQKTSLTLDYLGNNYYVIYAKDTPKSTNTLKVQDTSTSNQIISDSIQKTNNTFFVKGIILNKKLQPIEGASIIENNTQNGTISLSDGTFSLSIKNVNNLIKISHVGYLNQTIEFQKKQLKVILKDDLFLDEVHIVGSRNKNRSKKDAPVATDIINIDKTIDNSGLTEVNELLEFAVPSFNATKQSGADGADHIVPATYRGLGPDQTLVLINGKRRHQASLINLYGTRGRGNSGTDLNAIPSSAIKRIEILKDGASAQYGSDAIAGVINVVLKDTANVLSANTTFGFHNANPNIQNVVPINTIDGITYKVDANYGIKIKEKGFINFSTEFLSKGHTFRAPTELRQKYGEAASQNVSLFFNSEVPIKGNTSFYAFGGYNFRNTEAFAFSRNADSERNVLAIYPNGFNPLITSDISDKSMSIGIKTSFKNWNIDINNTYGSNNFHYTIKETLNATLQANSPTEFDAGGHQLMQNTTSIDFSRYFMQSLKGINVAFGFEHRIENYQIFAGEESSYSAYDINGNLVNSQTPNSDLVTYNGFVRPGGSQGFPGYSPMNEVNEDRTNFSFYIDTEFDFTKKWMLATAIRYEYYNDFGSTLNTKLATRIKLSPNINIRSSFSTGFRAPSLAQIYYNLTFTNYLGNLPVESLLVANNNPITQKLGIDKLKEEKAINTSFGFAANYEDFSFSLDSYYVSIKDRIILSGIFDATNLGVGNVDNIQFFANGVDTETIGLDLKARWYKKIGDSKLSINFNGNINKMSISQIKHRNLDKETFFGIREQHFLLASAPKSKFNLGINYQKNKFSSNLNITRYSGLKLIDWQIQEPIYNFNNSIEERITAATDIYEPKYTVDINFKYQLFNFLNYQLGINNLFNTYPTVQGNHVDSGGLWDAIQMGTNGTFFYTKLSFKL
ncbi:TonB-dependent receptor [uncultured Tenacibaculum sp.]|uniref:TonB-dependent receptor n=1 Tax=uncultured Tenacibaculum sp. TaxID=174713 RepID=UPI00263385CC|nr:TonB-dependent receptor [uncultured Tenacibaculum sp.]